MRAVIQRVNRANVKVDHEVVGRIGKGLLVLLAIHQDDGEDKIAKMADKIINLRILSDQEGKMNLSLKDTAGEVLVVSQFTLYGDTAKGNRPSFAGSAEKAKAEEYYRGVIRSLSDRGIKTEAGIFGAMMEVEIVNDGPVTLILDV